MKLFKIALAVFSLLLAPAFAGTSPEKVTGAITTDTTSATQLFDNGVVFVDVRKPSDFEAGRVPGAIHLDLKSTYNQAALEASVGKDDQVVIYCNGANCMRSSKAAVLAVEWGFTKVFYYRDGFPAWDAAGNPVE